MDHPNPTHVIARGMYIYIYIHGTKSIGFWGSIFSDMSRILFELVKENGPAQKWLHVWDMLRCQTFLDIKAARKFRSRNTNFGKKSTTSVTSATKIRKITWPNSLSAAFATSTSPWPVGGDHFVGCPVGSCGHARPMTSTRFGPGARLAVSCGSGWI